MDISEADRTILRAFAPAALAALSARHPVDAAELATWTAQASILSAPGPLDVAAWEALGTGEDISAALAAARRWHEAGAPLDNPWAPSAPPLPPSPWARSGWSSATR